MGGVSRYSDDHDRSHVQEYQWGLVQLIVAKVRKADIRGAQSN